MTIKYQSKNDKFNCDLCGSALGSDQIFSETARQVGHTIAEQGKTLVYGGGRFRA